MAKIIEAKAVISGEDRLSGVLDRVNAKLQQVGKGAKISADLDHMNRSLANTKKQLEAVGKVNAAQERLNSAKLGATGAQARADRVAAQLAGARKANDTAATAALVAQHKEAARAVDQATRAVERQSGALRTARKDLTGFGVPIANLAAHENALKASAGKTVAAIEHETTALRRRDEAAAAEARRRAEIGQPVPAARRRRDSPARRGSDAPGFGPVQESAAALIGGFGAVQAYKNAAAFDRRLTMIGQTADASREQIDAIGPSVHDLAQQTATPLDKLAGGLEALVAQGRSLQEANEFLPSIARTALASGSEVDDIAKSADTVGTNFKIAGSQMQNAFDIMAAGGKAGQFELRDMARYLPSLGPAASAIGFEGKKGLADLVALLQVVRKGSGTAEEAVASVNNILAKMESDKTTKNFKALGVDAPAAFAKARKEGRNLVDVFEELVNLALKGDRSRLGELIDDMELKRGVQALMTYRGEREKLSATLQKSAGGTVERDMQRPLNDAQAGLVKIENTYARVTQALARGVDAIGLNGRLQGMAGEIEAVAKAIEHAQSAYQKGGVQGVAEETASAAKAAAEKVQNRLEASLAESKLGNLEYGIKDQQQFIRQKEEQIARAQRAIEGGGFFGWQAKGSVEPMQRDLAQMREKLMETERQRDILKNGPRPLRMGADPTAPIQGKPGLVKPGVQSWQDAYPLVLGTRTIPLPPQRPSSLPNTGPPAIADALAGGGSTSGWSRGFGGPANAPAIAPPVGWSPGFSGPIEANVKPDQITARVTDPVSVSGEANVSVESRVNVAVTLNEPMLQAKIDAAAGRAAAKIPLSSGARAGSVSMPGAAATPGAAPAKADRP